MSGSVGVGGAGLITRTPYLGYGEQEGTCYACQNSAEGACYLCILLSVYLVICVSPVYLVIGV